MLVNNFGTSLHLVPELSRAQNAELLPSGLGDIVISPQIVSYVMTQVALARPLGRVYDALFMAGGTEIALVPVVLYGESADEATFGEIEKRVAAHGQTALGVVVESGQLLLNPSRTTSVATRSAHVVSFVTVV
ncbi:MAG: hypothetical protein ACOCU9_01105 [Spirochaetota bacterium]